MVRIVCKECKKPLSKKAKSCSHCGALIETGKVKKQKKWHERTSVTLCVAAVLIIAGLGFVHIITGIVSPYRLPFDITLKESFGYRETFINARKITAIPYVAAKLKYPLGCKILQKLEYIETGKVFETKMVEQLREAINIWQAEFEEGINKPEQQWQDHLQGQFEAIEKNTSSAEAYNNRGIEAAKKGEYETAISEFTRVFQKNPGHANAYYNRGLVYVAIGQLGQAISDFTQTIEIKPEFTEAYTHRGRIYVTMNQYDQAIPDFTKVLEMDPKCAKVYFRRALVYFAKGLYVKAWQDVREIQSLGLPVPQGFLKNLRKASGIEK